MQTSREMAEQDPHQLPAGSVTPDCHTGLIYSENCGLNVLYLSDVEEGETHSTNVDHISASDRHKHEEAGVETAHSGGKS